MDFEQFSRFPKFKKYFSGFCDSCGMYAGFFAHFAQGGLLNCFPRLYLSSKTVPSTHAKPALLKPEQHFRMLVDDAERERFFHDAGCSAINTFLRSRYGRESVVK